MAGCARARVERGESIFMWHGLSAVWFVHLDKHCSAKQIRPYLAHTNHSRFRLLCMHSFVHAILSTPLLSAFPSSRLRYVHRAQTGFQPNVGLLQFANAFQKLAKTNCFVFSSFVSGSLGVEVIF